MSRTATVKQQVGWMGIALASAAALLATSTPVVTPGGTQDAPIRVLVCEVTPASAPITPRRSQPIRHSLTFARQLSGRSR